MPKLGNVYPGGPLNAIHIGGLFQSRWDKDSRKGPGIRPRKADEKATAVIAVAAAIYQAARGVSGSESYKR